MKLGIVGMLPGDFRTHEPEHFETIRDLGFTGAGFHFPGDLSLEITDADLDRARGLFTDHDVDLVQFAVTYPECLFDPDQNVRRRVTSKIVDTAEVASAIGADYYLIRPGSRNPSGSWTPHRDNHASKSWSLLIDTLSDVVQGLKRHNVVAVMETHLVSILRDPETCLRLVEQIESPNLRLVMDYVNHFESLKQVYSSRNRLEHIFDTLGSVSPVMHIKDVALGKGLVLHIEECVPGMGELNLAHAFQRFHNQHPDGYGLIEHLKPDLVPEAKKNTQNILKRAGITVQ